MNNSEGMLDNQASANLHAICDNEPITCPGKIQSFGALVAFDCTTRTIRFESLNAASFLEVDAPSLLNCALDAVFPKSAISRIDDLLRSERYAHTNFTTLSTQRGSLLDAVIHQVGNLAIVECMLGGDVDAAARGISEAQAVLSRLRDENSLASLLDAAADQFKMLTGYDRVMVYRFNEEQHGQIVAEARRPDLKPFLGLHYPASDIPPQARQMYLLQRVRVIPDVRETDIALQGAPGCVTSDLDMTYSVLRAVSPNHIEYLINMGVRATLAISLIVDGALWGMIVCHHDAPRGIDCTLRGLCDMLGQSLSEMIATRAEIDLRHVLAQRTQALVEVERALDEAAGIGAALGTVTGDLLRLMNAGGAYLSVGGAVHHFGNTPPPDACRRILERLTRDFPVHGGVSRLDVLDPDFEDVRLTASGAFVILLPNTPGDGIVFFRPEETVNVSWGGDPKTAIHIDEETGRLGPRRSFAKWVEVVRGTSERWSDVDERIAVALRRCLIGVLLRISEEQVAYLANHESGTSLLTASSAEKRLRRIVANRGEAVVGLFLISIAHLGAIVARDGQAVASRVEAAVIERLRRVMARHDHLARFDAETLQLIARRPDPEQLRVLGTALLDTVRFTAVFGSTELVVSARVGAAYSPGVAVGDLSDTARKALAEAQADARSRFVMRDRAIVREGPSHGELVLDIGPAITRGEIRAVFQPLIKLDDDCVIGLEALCRFDSAIYGPVSPDRFIPAAVEAGQIFLLTTTMIDLALKAAAPLIRSGDIEYVSVNLDAAALTRRSISAVARSALDAHGLPYSALVLEVTETSMFTPEAVEAIARLRHEGIRIALDDFGAGYSSLGALARMPVDIVKIDRQLVADIAIDARAAAVFAAVRGLVGALDLACIAEGIETQEQRDLLAAHDLTAGQGYLLARPMDEKALLAFLQKRQRDVA